jgi:hypothetical protein
MKLSADHTVRFGIAGAFGDASLVLTLRVLRHGLFDSGSNRLFTRDRNLLAQSCFSVLS